MAAPREDYNSTVTELLSSTQETLPRVDTSERTKSLAPWLKVVGDPTRLRILDLLMQGTQCNCELGSALGLAPNLISHHLSVLRRAGLVTAERHPTDARWVYYTVDRAALKELQRAFGSFFDAARLQERDPFCCSPSSNL
jgi:ArsR family transcriptional regulator